MKKILLLSLHFIVFSAFVEAQSWSEIGASYILSDGTIETITTDSSGNIYAAGNFYDINSNSYVIEWNGTIWTELGTGTNALNANKPIASIIANKSGNIYAGGSFTNAKGKYYVAEWNGTSWSELGGTNALGANGKINTIVTDKSGNIYAAGAFTDGSGYNYVAKWNGTSWTELGSLNVTGAISTIAVDASGNVYAGGSFQDINGYFYVAKWNGSTWTELNGSGTNGLNANGQIYSIAVSSTGNVYAGGNFTDSGDDNYVAEWNGTTWTELGGSGSGGLNSSSPIQSITIDKSGNVYAEGTLYNTSGENVAKWNSTSWTILGNGSYALNANSYILTLTTDKYGNIYAAGAFTGKYYEPYVAEWSSGTKPTATLSPQDKPAISIYPNPGTGIVHIPALSEMVQLTVYSLSGTVVSTQQLAQGSLYADLSSFSSGIYTLVFSGQTTAYAPVKWVKE